MPNKFIDLNGDYKRSRLSSTGIASVSEEDVSEPGRLADIINDLTKRIAALEANRPQEWIEFERQVTAAGSGNVTLEHNFSCPVRYTVVHWKGSAAHSFNVNETLSTTNKLVLNSLVAGRVVIRVEKSQYNVVKGTT